MSRDRNAQTIERGLNQARQLIKTRLANRLYTIGRKITENEVSHKEYLGFTGNAQTSYMSQVWVDGQLASEYNTGDYQPSPIREKVEHNKVVHLENPYEGEARSVMGKAEIQHPWATQTLDAIDRDKPDVENGLAIRFAVGVEYQDYIGNPIGAMLKSALFDINERTLKIDVRN